MKLKLDAEVADLIRILRNPGNDGVLFVEFILCGIEKSRIIGNIPSCINASRWRISYGYIS